MKLNISDFFKNPEVCVIFSLCVLITEGDFQALIMAKCTKLIFYVEAIKVSLPFITPRIKLKEKNEMSYCLEVDCFQAEISTSLSSFGNPTPVFRLQI